MLPASASQLPWHRDNRERLKEAEYEVEDERCLEAAGLGIMVTS
jgi:hypothetical protein